MTVIGTALSGLQASVARLNAVASNVANANSTGVAPGSVAASGASTPQPYQPQRVVQSSLATGGVSTRTVSDASYRLQSDPTSPYANADGLVAAPDVDLASELVEQIVAQISFSANLSVFRAANSIQGQLVDRLV